MLARVKEFDGDDDKLLAEYQQDIESDQRGEFRPELKDRVADSLRVHLHAERERCVIALGDQLSADNRVCERMRVQIAHTSVTLDEANAKADIASSTRVQRRSAVAVGRRFGRGCLPAARGCSQGHGSSSGVAGATVGSCFATDGGLRAGWLARNEVRAARCVPGRSTDLPNGGGPRT